MTQAERPQPVQLARRSCVRRAGVLRATLLAAVAVSTAYALRHGLVEPQAWAVRCEVVPWGEWRCVLRDATVQAFADQRLGWAALTLALLATLTRWRAVALFALVAGCAGLVLYTADLGAPAVLLAALVLVRPSSAHVAPSLVEAPEQ